MFNKLTPLPKGRSFCYTFFCLVGNEVGYNGLLVCQRKTDFDKIRENSSARKLERKCLNFDGKGTISYRFIGVNP